MAVLMLLVLILGITGHSTATWCICKDGLSDSALQKTIDYACGAGADCGPTHQNGACFAPNTVKAHCSYAVNSYFQRKGQAQGSCDFAGTAIISASDPSTTGCVYPSSASATGTTTTTPVSTNPPGTTNSPGTTTTNTPTTTTTAPYTTTPSTGVLGGVGSGMGPTSINNDYSDGGLRLQASAIMSFFVMPFFAGLMLLWG